MPIPALTGDGVLPPYIGGRGPGDFADDMSPYVATALEVANTFGRTSKRRSILRGWLDHRAAMRGAGFRRGFQWLDGSFVEDKVPSDLDVVTFLYRPPGVGDRDALATVIHAHSGIFQRTIVRQRYCLDHFPVDLNGSPEGIVATSRYFLGLFSHRREDSLWKGMIQVRLEDRDDDVAAIAALGPNPTNQ